MGRRSRTADAAYNFWPAYTDVALGMVFVLVLYLLGQLVQNRLATEPDESFKTVRERQDSVWNLVSRAPGVVRQQQDGTLQTITLSADVLFSTDSTELTDEGLTTVDSVGAILCRNDRYFSRLAVEGHADQLPSRKFFEDPKDGDGNWWLSAERAVRVVQRLQHRGIDGGKLEAIARSWYAPADTSYRSVPNWRDRTAERAVDASLRRNRRLIIRIVYSVHSGEAQSSCSRGARPESRQR